MFAFYIRSICCACQISKRSIEMSKDNDTGVVVMENYSFDNRDGRMSVSEVRCAPHAHPMLI